MLSERLLREEGIHRSLCSGQAIEEVLLGERKSVPGTGTREHELSSTLPQCHSSLVLFPSSEVGGGGDSWSSRSSLLMDQMETLEHDVHRLQREQARLDALYGVQVEELLRVLDRHALSGAVDRVVWQETSLVGVLSSSIASRISILPVSVTRKLTESLEKSVMQVIELIDDTSRAIRVTLDVRWKTSSVRGVGYVTEAHRLLDTLAIRREMLMDLLRKDTLHMEEVVRLCEQIERMTENQHLVDHMFDGYVDDNQRAIQALRSERQSSLEFAIDDHVQEMNQRERLTDHTVQAIEALSSLIHHRSVFDSAESILAALREVQSPYPIDIPNRFGGAAQKLLADEDAVGQFTASNVAARLERGEPYVSSGNIQLSFPVLSDVERVEKQLKLMEDARVSAERSKSMGSSGGLAFELTNPRFSYGEFIRTNRILEGISRFVSEESSASYERVPVSSIPYIVLTHPLLSEFYQRLNPSGEVPGNAIVDDMKKLLELKKRLEKERKLDADKLKEMEYELENVKEAFRSGPIVYPIPPPLPSKNESSVISLRPSNADFLFPPLGKKYPRRPAPSKPS